MAIRKMNYYFLGIAIFISLVIILLYFINYIPNGEVITNSKKGNINTNSLTMMYETESNSGEYQVASDSMWPIDEYAFNENLSKCENGSKLTWDDENKKVIIQSNTSDRCYVYFDIDTDVHIKYSSGESSTYFYSTDGQYWIEVEGTLDDMSFPVGTYIKGFTDSSKQYNIVFCSSDNCSNSTSGDVTKLGTATSYQYYIITGEEVTYAYYNFVCLVGDTPVYVYDKKNKKRKKKKIRDIKVGDLVYSFNEKENKYIYSKVTKVEKVYSKEVYVLKFKDGEIVKCSRGHSFYVSGMEYMSASQLKPGYKILGMDNLSHELLNVEAEYHTNEVELYNIYIDNNNCFVSNLGILSYALVASIAFLPYNVEASPPSSA